MKVYIHGGFHKTATCSIEKLLAGNASLAPLGPGNILLSIISPDGDATVTLNARSN